MTRATLDTNVLVSGFVGRFIATSTPDELIRAWRRGLFQLAISEILLREFARTLDRPYFRQRMTATDVAAALALLRAEATVIELTVSVTGVATHPEDDLIVATAVSAHTDYLVTDDRRLRELRTYAGIPLLSPREFLDLLRREEPLCATE